MKKPAPDPRPGDEVIVTRCDQFPMLAGETGEIVEATPLGNFYKIATADVLVICGRGDFILRKVKA